MYQKLKDKHEMTRMEGMVMMEESGVMTVELMVRTLKKLSVYWM
jgi:hypothetical protein